MEHYLAIQQIRFEGRLDCTTQIEPDALAAQVPSLILQPLVENAVEHGLAPDAEPGRIVLSAKREDGDLRLAVRDDGAGLPPEWDENDLGLGLRNTVERLRQLYGKRARLDIRNEGSGGVTAELILPWRTDVEA